MTRGLFSPQLNARNRGFSLVELLIGMALAIIGLLVMSTVMMSSNQQKKTTTSGADAQTSGSIGSYAIERDLRMAGYGISGTGLLGCKINAYDEGSVPARSFTFNLLPVVITAGVAGAPDTIEITYSDSDVGINAPRLTQSNNGTNAEYKVDNRFGFHEGNLIVVSEPGVDQDGDGQDDCTLAQVTGVPGTPGKTDNVIHNSGMYTNASGQNVPARYNKPGGLGIPYSTNAHVYNLGDLPGNRIYTVDTATNQLTFRNTLVSAAAVGIGENMVMLRAFYAKDTNGDGAIDLYDQVLPTSSALWDQVIGVRFSLVARSHTRESDMVSPASLELWPAQTLNGNVYAAPTMALSDEQRHYRYKVFQTLVPLRNQIWRP